MSQFRIGDSVGRVRREIQASMCVVAEIRIASSLLMLGFEELGLLGEEYRAIERDEWKLGFWVMLQ